MSKAMPYQIIKSNKQIIKKYQKNKAMPYQRNQSILAEGGDKVVKYDACMVIAYSDL